MSDPPHASSVVDVDVAREQLRTAMLRIVARRFAFGSGYTTMDADIETALKAWLPRCGRSASAPEDRQGPSPLTNRNNNV